ncbi:hypothetical protein [Candidatus Pantoea multigeneris]|uniref:Uncharacterized protein n=1 Tax=Candidatus Pantoea multigeneris TaxID=2608357 RepID=A0ABX0R5Y1_9GAMM|nr:hypothetical protein [Pantoea multigeneris]NIF20813.1 hypothetical protein [Pantoea multigeneris]
MPSLTSAWSFTNTGGIFQGEHPLHLRLHQGDIGNEKTMTAWPFPGAEAKRGRGRVKPIKTVTIKAQAPRPASTRRNPLLRRAPSQSTIRLNNNSAARNAPVVPAVAHSNSAGGNTDSAKESMTVSASYNSYVGKRNKLAEINRAESEGKNNLRNDPPPAVTKSGSSIAKSLLVNAFSTPENTTSTAVSPLNISLSGTAPRKTAVSLACFDFIDTTEARSHLQQQIIEQSNNYFCVKPGNQGLFKSFFTSGLKITSHSDIAAMCMLPCRHNLPRDKESFEFIGYSQKENMTLATSRSRDNKKKPDIYSVVTLSLLLPDEAKNRTLPKSLILPANSFKIINFPDLSGEYHHFLAFHANQHDSDNGFNTGIYPVSVQDGVFILKHPQSGLEFSSSSLEKLVSGLIKQTGFSYAFDSASQKSKNALSIREIVPTYAQSLFISNNETISESITRNKINPELSFISSYPTDENNGASALIKGSFTLINDTLCYVDFKGAKGEMVLNIEVGDPGKIKIHITNQQEADLFNHLGMSLATSYRKEELIELMDAKGITYLPNDDSPYVSLPAKSDDFYIDEIYQSDSGENKHIHSVGNGASVSSPKYTNCFSIRDKSLYLYDQNGRFRTVKFNTTLPGEMFMMDDNTRADESFVIKRFNFTPGHSYRRDELMNIMKEMSLVHHPEMILPH